MIKWIKWFTLLYGVFVFGQGHRVEGKINPISKSGLHRIAVPNDVRSFSAMDLRDFRIRDAKGIEVPYYLEPSGKYNTIVVSNFSAFEMISKTKIKDTSSTYIFKNPYTEIDRAVLLIANYEGYKTYRVEGSNDQNQWFGIVNRGQLSQINNPTNTEIYKVINFPKSKYKYFKLVFDDLHSLPVFLIDIGEAKTETVNTVPLTMQEISMKTVTIEDTEQTTQIVIEFEKPELIDEIRLEIIAPDFYNRTAKLFAKREREVKQKTENYKQQLATFAIRSDEPLVLKVPKFKEEKIYLEIDNKDNPKLEFTKLTFLQTPIYVVVALKEGESYKVTTGDSTLNYPDYDLLDVTNTEKQILPIAEITDITYTKPDTELKVSDSFWQQSWFMWCCITVAALIITYFAFSLLKDLNTDKSEIT